MKVLVLGGDGRAHALAWKLFNSPATEQVVCAPGNGGTGQIAPALDFDIADAAGIARWAFDQGIDIIVPAESRPLHFGLVDEVVAFHGGVCGPSLRSTVLEQSRCRAKEFMLRHQLPSAPGRSFADIDTAEKFLATCPPPVIIKADHPAAGEAIYHDRYAALTGLRDLFAAQPADAASAGVVIESWLEGPRVVFSAFTDGRTAVPLLPVRLYDRVEPGDAGPLASGIGAHTSASRYAELLADFLHKNFIVPIVKAMAEEDMPIWGLLGVDCIITANGPRLTAIRFSMREGEAQVVLPRLADDLLPWAQAMIAQRLHELPPPAWTPLSTVGVGVFARGYPHHFSIGGMVSGLDALDSGVLAFHSATDYASGLRYTPHASAGAGLLGLRFGGEPDAHMRTTGGHVLTIVAGAPTLEAARQHALANAARVAFDGRTFRADIGAKEFG